MGIEGLDFQLVNVEFTQGLDTSNSRKLKVPGKWIEADNVCFTEANVSAGAAEPAEGSVRIRDSVTVINATLDGNGLATHDGELLVINGSAVKTVATDGRGYASPGQAGFVGVSRTTAFRNQDQQDSMDCASTTTAGGVRYTCYVWRTKDSVNASTGVAISLIDEATGAFLFNAYVPRLSATIKCPRVVAIASGFLVFYADMVATPVLYGVVIDTTGTPAIGAETALITSASFNATGAGFDACLFGGALNQALIAYPWNDGVTSVRASYITIAAMVPAIGGTLNVTTQAQLNNAAISGIAVAIFASTITHGLFISATAGGALGGGVIGATISTTPVVTNGPTQIDTTVNPTAGATHIVACAYAGKNGAGMACFVDQISNYGGVGGLRLIRRVVVGSALTILEAASTLCNSNAFNGAGLGAPAGPQGPWIAGKCFGGSGAESLFLPVCVQESYFVLGAGTVSNNQQNTFYVLDGVTGVAVARAMVGNYGVPLDNIGGLVTVTPCGTPAVSATGFALLAPDRTRLVLQGGVTNISPTGVARLTLDPNFTLAPVKQQLGPSTYLAGGSLTNYDGFNAFEHGFHLYPEGIGAIPAATGGGAVTAGVHQVVVVYEWTDNQGQRQQSAPSTAVSVTVGGANNSITVRIPTLQLTQKVGVSLVPYMTAAAGLTFFRCITRDAALTTAMLANSKAVAELTFTVMESDATISAQEILYTQPNQSGTTLPNTAPPPSSALCVHQGRIFCDVTDEPGTYAFSQQQVSGVGLQWNDSLRGRVDVSSGGLVGLCELDEKVIIFGARRLFAVLGTGPNSAGGFDNYSEPIPIETDAGCSDPLSILRMPQGIIFKATKGWYLLGRDLSVRPIGDGVAKYNSFPVSSAVLMEDRAECRFTVTNTESAEARTLVFAYGQGQWSTFSFGVAGYFARDAMWWPSRYEDTGYGYVSLSATDGLNGDSVAGAVDTLGARTPQTVIKTLQTSFLKLSTLTGFQRVRWLYLTMTQLSASVAPAGALTVSLFYDDDTTGTAPGSYSFTVALSALAGLTNTTDSLDFRHKLRRQKCKSVSFRLVEDPGPASANPLAGLQALGLQLGIKRGTNKLPASQTSG